MIENTSFQANEIIYILHREAPNDKTEVEKDFTIVFHDKKRVSLRVNPFLKVSKLKKQVQRLHRLPSGRIYRLFLLGKEMKSQDTVGDYLLTKSLTHLVIRATPTWDREDGEIPVLIKFPNSSNHTLKVWSKISEDLGYLRKSIFNSCHFPLNTKNIHLFCQSQNLPKSLQTTPNIIATHQNIDYSLIFNEEAVKLIDFLPPISQRSNGGEELIFLVASFNLETSITTTNHHHHNNSSSISSNSHRCSSKSKSSIQDSGGKRRLRRKNKRSSLYRGLKKGFLN